ncbi:MAG: Ni/Fe hydrogenase subunit gamma [Planctomycetota bacterium]|nr:MAG: Ni/Fe hydrogenase subunit gamma [Planctomycetota bacterium]
MSIPASTTPSSSQQVPNPWQAHAVSIRSIQQEIDGVSTYDLAFDNAAADGTYRFSPGQFNMLYLPGAGEIAISVSDDPARSASSCRHTVRTAGNVTRTLGKLQPGDTLGLRGPFGTAWPMADCIGRDVIIVAGGIGLAPLRPAIYTLLRERRCYGRLNLLLGARSPGTLLYRSEFAQWEERGLVVQTTVDQSTPDWTGNVGVVTLLLERLRSFDPTNSVLLCCGPEVMMKFTAVTAQHRGIPPERIWISMERNMQCAVGLCGHCQWGPEFVCKDGPVFRYDRIARWIDVERL